MRCFPLSLALCIVLLSLTVRAGDPAPQAPAKDAPTETRVGAETRIDWQFAVTASFGPNAGKLPADYDSTKQHYQLFVPKNYDGAKRWPLVVFISPADGAGAWRFWQKSCTQMGMLYCEAHGAGNNCPVARRTRIVLDVLDDVRRNYRIDPDQTYLAGFSGGGRMACSLAFALPEYFGGVLPICGTNPWTERAYLRHRVRDRLSVAFVTGTGDFNRKENEALRFPLFQGLGVRAKLWVVPDVGHAIPGPAVLTEVHKWLAADLPRRQADAKARPGLTVAPGEAPAAEVQAARQLEAAKAELERPERVWRAAALALGVVERWAKSPAAKPAVKFLDQLKADPEKVKLLAEQRTEEDIQEKSAEAKVWEGFGSRGRALKAWRELGEKYPDSPAAKKAAEEVKRLEAAIVAAPKRPFLGVSFEGNTLKVRQVEKAGPAANAGVKPGDLLVKLDDAKIDSLMNLVAILGKRKPGDQVALAVERDGKSVMLQVKLGARPAPGDE